MSISDNIYLPSNKSLFIGSEQLDADAIRNIEAVLVI